MSGACFKKLTLIRGSRSVNHFYLEKRLDKITQILTLRKMTKKFMKSDLRRINRHQMSLLPGKVKRQKQNNPETLSCQLRISFFELDLGHIFMK